MNDDGEKANRFKESAASIIGKIHEDKVYVIVLLIIISTIYTIVFALIHGFLYTEKIFTLNSDESFIPDFIEMLWEAYKGTPYEDGCTYLPLTFLFLKILSFLTPVLSEVDTFIMPITDPRMPQLITLYAVTVIICLGFAIWAALQHVNGTHRRFVIVFLILLSSSMIWTIERGNLVYMGFALLMYYCLNYDSESERKRRLSIICLVLAVSIKPYFCVFAVLLLRDRRFNKIIATVISLLIVNIIAIQFFGGFSSIPLLITNMVELNDSLLVFEGFKMDIINTINIIGKIIDPDFFFDSIILKVSVAVALVIESLLVKDRCIGLTAAIFSYIMFTNISWVYLLILLIIPIAMFMKKGEQENGVLFIIISLTLLMFPIDHFIPVGIEHVSYIYLVFAVCYMIVSVVLGLDGIRRLIIKVHESLSPRVNGTV